MSTTRHDRAARRLRIPRHVGYAMLAAIIGAASVAGGSAAGVPVPPKPAGLQTFQLRLGEDRSTTGSEVPTFSRTPSFAWAPVRGAVRYEFELSTSDQFGAANAVVWSTTKLTTPAVSIPIALPWITGSPASLYWHVRAVTVNGALSDWSAPGRFNMRWPDARNADSAHDTLGVPMPVNAGAGAIAWTPIEGATGYEVWYTTPGFSHHFKTTTTVADEREFGHVPAGTVIDWRIRAKRALYGTTSNKLPRVSYGPWSTTYHTRVTHAKRASLAMPLNTISSEQVLSNAVTASAGPAKVVSGGIKQAHAVMPVFLFSQDAYAYHRVYVATDKDCVNVVFKGQPVAGSAYAPRLLPTSEQQKGAAQLDLWDSNWASGRYYWTVVPVKALVEKPKTKGKTTTATAITTATPSTATTTPPPVTTTTTTTEAPTAAARTKVVFRDAMIPQDACQQVGVRVFRKNSPPPVLASVTGLSPGGKLLSSTNGAAGFYGVPLVTWTPANNAVGYDVEWSRDQGPRGSYPWRKAGSLETYASSALLPLQAGAWWYRVRGVNPSLSGNTKMSWSKPVKIVITKPIFNVIQ